MEVYRTQHVRSIYSKAEQGLLYLLKWFPLLFATISQFDSFYIHPIVSLRSVMDVVLIGIVIRTII